MEVNYFAPWGAKAHWLLCFWKKHPKVYKIMVGTCIFPQGDVCVRVLLEWVDSGTLTSSQM